MTDNISPEFLEQCLSLCRQGKHLTAHRMFMGETGASFLEAKEHIDRLCRENGIIITSNEEMAHTHGTHARQPQGLSKKTLLIATLTTIIIILVALFIAGE